MTLIHILCPREPDLAAKDLRVPLATQLMYCSLSSSRSPSFRNKDGGRFEGENKELFWRSIEESRRERERGVFAFSLHAAEAIQSITQLLLQNMRAWTEDKKKVTCKVEDAMKKTCSRSTVDTQLKPPISDFWKGNLIRLYYKQLNKNPSGV